MMETTTRGRAIQLPVSIDEWAVLQADFPLTEAKWNQMLAVLTAMKPALVAPERRESPRQHEPGIAVFDRENDDDPT